jgi:hypothetical protein
VIKEYPRPDSSMMAARVAAFSGPSRPEPFDHARFSAQDIRVTSRDCQDRPDPLIGSIVDCLATPPDGLGVGYCLVNGLAALMTVESARRFSSELCHAVWARYRARCTRIAAGRAFRHIETLTDDGRIPEQLYGSRWTFKPPHADRNGVLFAHVYGPHTGFSGGEILLVDALAFARDRGIGFDETMTWSDGSGPQKPVLRAEHFRAALDGYGRRFGQLSPDAILFVNNGPEGLLHGATDLLIRDENQFSRPLHRVVVREADEADA